MAPIPELEEIRKTQILDAGLAVIAQYGCQNVTMALICEEAGLSKGGLAHYYKSKKELFKAVFKEFFRRIFKRGRDTMDEYSDPLEKLLSFTWLFNSDDLDANLGYPILFDFMSIAVHDDDYKRIFHQWVSSWLELLKEAIHKGKRMGLYRNIDPDTAAKTISAIYQGIATRWFLAKGLHSDEWARDALVKAVTGVLAVYDGTKTNP